MQPLFDKIFAIPIPKEQKSASGLALDNTDYKQARVVFTGPGHQGAPMTVKKGDIIIYPGDCGLPFSDWEGEPGIVLTENQIHLIL